MESIENDSETLFNELQSLELDSLQPWYVRNNESYPEIDVLKRIVVALNKKRSANTEKVIKCFPKEFIDYCLN